MLEEGGQFCQALTDALDCEWGAAIRFGILEVEADTLTAQPSVGKAARGRHDRWRNHSAGSRQVEAIRPLLNVVGALEPDHVLLPPQMSRIEVTSQAESDIEIRVLQEHTCQGQS